MSVASTSRFAYFACTLLHYIIGNNLPPRRAFFLCDTTFALLFEVFRGS